MVLETRSRTSQTVATAPLKTGSKAGLRKEKDTPSSTGKRGKRSVPSICNLWCEAKLSRGGKTSSPRQHFHRRCAAHAIVVQHLQWLTPVRSEGTTPTKAAAWFAGTVNRLESLSHPCSRCEGIFTAASQFQAFSSPRGGAFSTYVISGKRSSWCFGLCGRCRSFDRFSTATGHVLPSFTTRVQRIERPDAAFISLTRRTANLGQRSNHSFTGVECYEQN